MVRLHGIVLFAHLGVTEAEREAGQKIQIDVEMAADLEAAGRSDALSATVDYQKAYRLIEETAATSRCRLLEALAVVLIDRLMEELPVSRVTIKISKPNVPFQGTVSAVEVELTRPR
jgi:dihydroneopterin aldolase